MASKKSGGWQKLEIDGKKNESGIWENKNVLLWNKKKAGSIGRGPFGSHLGSLLFGAHLGPILPSLGPILGPILIWGPFWGPFGGRPSLLSPLGGLLVPLRTAAGGPYTDPE